MLVVECNLANNKDKYVHMWNSRNQKLKYSLGEIIMNSPRVLQTD